jgi:hypothetical protein
MATASGNVPPGPDGAAATADDGDLNLVIYFIFE